MFKTVISTDVLEARLADPLWVIVDCRFKLDDVAWGEREWTAAHIPGAVYAHLDRDLSGPKTGTNGRHPLPDVDVLARTFGRFGITSGRQVVAYDQNTGMFASRLWWLLRWLGHDAVAVLDGGFAKWIAEGRPVSTAVAGRGLADRGLARPGALSRSGRADRPGGRAHTRRDELLFPVEHRRGWHFPH